VFVGRSREADALDAALRRGPLACVWGVGGLGKSALVLHVLHERFPAQVPRTIVVRLTRTETIDQALVTVATALAAIEGVTGIDWRSLLADRDALVATAIDLAEGPGAPRGRGRDAPAYWVIFEDVHHAAPARAAEVLAQLAQYGRRSRWLAVSRTNALPNEAMGQAVALGAMDASELRDIGQRWGSSGIDERAIAAAAGSPWRLKQLMSGAQPGLEPGTDDPLEDLAPGVAPFLADLSVLDAELPLAALARFTEPPPPDALQALERRGLIERGPGGLRLHDVARPFAAARLDAARTRERRLAAARALCEAPETTAWLEGLRLLVEEGDAARAAEELDRRGAAMIDAGSILGLWRVLERAGAPELASWRLRCAIDIGDPPALRGVPEPPSPSARDRARWSLSLFQQGRYEEAFDAGEAAQRAALDAGDADLACDAGRTSGRAVFALGRFDRALSVFKALVPTTPRQAAQRDTDIAACLVGLERHEDALDLIRGVDARLEADPSLGDSALHYAAAWVLCQVGALHLAERGVRRLSASSGGVRLYGMASARHLFLAIAVAHDRGALSEAAELLEKLLPLALRSPVYAVFAGIHRALIRLALGQLDAIDEDLARLIESAEKTPRDDLVQTARALRCRLAIVRGEPPSGSPPVVAPDRTCWEDCLLLWDGMHRARWSAPDRDPVQVRSRAPEARILALISRAWHALSAGEVASARRIADEATAASSATGHGLMEAFARECAAVAALLSTDPDDIAAEAAESLSAFARARGAAPLIIEGELLSLVASPDRFNPARIEAIAASPFATPAARRARALLGDPAPLDRIDSAILVAARRRTRARIERVVGGPPARGAAWGLDERTQTVWLPDRAFSLGDRPLLWRILRVLADAGGSAEKETLVIRAWGQREYHPLRDDARLHTAIRTLRRIIEEDRAHPARLVTTEGGYALGRDAPVRVLVVDSG
jgi:tetratricopeptide (TPR) repeat protein